jgi:hypothetical protein
MPRRNRLFYTLPAVGVLLFGGCTDNDHQAQPTLPTGLSVGGSASPGSSQDSSSSTDCQGAVTTASLPTWARAGFHPPGVKVPYVEGARGDIVGVVFGQPLTAPQPDPGRQNKILWVSRVGGGQPLKIDATLLDSDVTVMRLVPSGPGPSIIDLPEAGCWRFDLTWSGYSDELYVPYVKG